MSVFSSSVGREAIRIFPLWKIVSKWKVPIATRFIGVLWMIVGSDWFLTITVALSSHWRQARSEVQEVSSLLCVLFTKMTDFDLNTQGKKKRYLKKLTWNPHSCTRDNLSKMNSHWSWVGDVCLFFLFPPQQHTFFSWGCWLAFLSQ